MIKKSMFVVFLFIIQQLNAQSNYDPYTLFSPQVYPVGGNEYRNGAGEPGPLYWQNRADYQILANIDEAKSAVSAVVTITYRNNSPKALPYIWLVLDQHLFKKDSRGSAKLPANGKSRYGDSKSAFDGGFRFKSMSILSEVGGKIQESQPDTIVTDTRMQVRLSKPLPSKAEIKIKMEYSFSIPEHGADRMGYLDTKNGRIFALAQWYPRVCVYDDIRGWNTDPYLGASEFYLEYGDFDVTITAPAEHVVVASGELLNPQEVLSETQYKRYLSAKESDKTIVIKTKDEIASSSSSKVKTWKYKLTNARDFAWSTSRSFIWDGCKINLPNGKRSFAQSVYPVESEGWVRSSEFVKGSVEGYSKKWYPYPYPVAVNVACNVSGMEYPGIIFCSWEDKGESLWGVTDHEMGHTWFPMIVGNNERRFGWMDEGFNTFINQINSKEFNKGEFAQGEMFAQPMAGMLTDLRTEKIMLTPDGMAERNIGLNLYYKPAIALSILRNYVIGERRFDEAFRKYINDWAYKHPTPWDFFRSMENSTGEDLYWFWKGLFLENYKLDQAITNVEANTEDTNQLVISLENKEKMAMPVILEATTISGKVIRQVFPVEIWQSTGKHSVKMPVPEKVRKVVIDPDGAFPDVDPKNNIWIGIK
ncbi:MAG: M1 family metallopeptidase [Sphingobacteriales bacterium]|jgi:hypothetical protein